VLCESARGPQSFDLVLKEPLAATRAGMVGAGRREVSIYRDLSDQLPVLTPRLLAAHPEGKWMVFNQLPGSRDPCLWAEAEYLLATDHLVSLHDRFWGLGDDLRNYRWLARPLSADFQFYVSAAVVGVQRLKEECLPCVLSDDRLLGVFDRLLQCARPIADTLRAAPLTLLHGDYWPGNLSVYPDGTLIAYDWQQAAIGPGVLDLFYFVQEGLWWFDSLPLEQAAIIARYREGLQKANGCTWSDADWAKLWDYALMWTFLSGWMDLLPTIPEAILQTRQAQFQNLWFDPLITVVNRWFPGD
jgi:hypothetical protein